MHDLSAGALGGDEGGELDDASLATHLWWHDGERIKWCEEVMGVMGIEWEG